MINTDWCWFSVQLENILNCNFVLKIFVRRLSWDLGAVVCGQMEAAILETLERGISDWEPLEHPQWEIWEIGNVQTISIMDWDGLGKLAPMIRSHNRVAHSGICNVTLHLIIDRCSTMTMNPQLYVNKKFQWSCCSDWPELDPKESTDLFRDDDIVTSSPWPQWSVRSDMMRHYEA